MTVHKAQGAEFRIVLMMLPYHPTAFIRRNILYTGITRAQEYVALFTPTPSLCYAIGNDQTDIRYTGLMQRLKEMK